MMHGRWRSDGGREGLVLANGGGELVMLVRIGGDCFWRYLVLQQLPDGRFAKFGAQQGGYMKDLGEPNSVQPTERERYLILAGEPTLFTTSYREEP